MNINGNELILASNPQTSVTEYLKTNGLLKKDGTPFKTVTVTTGYHTFSGSSHRHDAITIDVKGKKTVFIKNIVTGSANGLHDILKSYGDVNVIIDGIELSSGFRVESDCVVTASGDKYMIGDGKESINGFIGACMTWLNRDNGALLRPLTERFLVACRLIRTDRNRLTGYANFERYLRMINKPSTFRMASSDSPELILDSEISISAEIIGDKIACKTSGIKILSGNNNSTPYVLFTTKPVNFGSDNLPFIIVRYSGLPIFISPFIANAGINLKAIKGGFDLLK